MCTSKKLNFGVTLYIFGSVLFYHMYFLTSFNLGCNAGYPVPSIPYSMMIYQSFLCWHLGQKLQLCVFHILRTQ